LYTHVYYILYSISIYSSMGDFIMYLIVDVVVVVIKRGQAPPHTHTPAREPAVDLSVIR
jgi:hypothetical protein